MKEDSILPFGKYKGKAISFVYKKDLPYLHWLHNELKSEKGRLYYDIGNQLNTDRCVLPGIGQKLYIYDIECKLKYSENILLFIEQNKVDLAQQMLQCADVRKNILGIIHFHSSRIKECKRIKNLIDALNIDFHKKLSDGQ